MLLAVAAVGLADVADPPAFVGNPNLVGIYKVVTSSDPLLPATRTDEVFLDFGRGLDDGRLSGKVAISLRRNPHVRVRIMVWQYFPQHGKLALGNPCVEGARDAVARVVWRLKGAANGVILERDHHLVVLRRADPLDF